MTTPATVVVQYPITVLLAQFMMPAVNGSATASVGATQWMVPGQGIVVAGLGTLIVTSILDATDVALENTGATGNAMSGTVALAGASVGVAGTPGPPGVWASSIVTLAASGTTTLTTAQQATPLLIMGAVTLVGNATLALNGVAGAFYLDFSAVTLNGHTLTVTNGSGSATVSSGTLVIASCVTTNSISLTPSQSGQYNVTLVNGINSNVNTNGHQSIIYVGGPTAAFSIDGLDHAPAAGEVVTIVNTTSNTMTFVVGTGSTSGQRISVIGTTNVPTQVRPGGMAQLTGNASPVSGPTFWLLTHTGYLRTTEVNPLDFGAKGDGVTNDSLACQQAINAAIVSTGALRVLSSPSGVNHYNLTQPLFTQGSEIDVVFDRGVEFVVESSVTCDAMIVSNPYPDPTYGTESGLSYVEFSGGGYINLSRTPAGSISGWGTNLTYTTANYTQGYSVTIAVNNNASLVVGNSVYIAGGGYYIVTAVNADTVHVTLQWIQQVTSYDVSNGSTVSSGAYVNSSLAGLTFEFFIDPVALLADGNLAYIAASSGKLGTAFAATTAFNLYLYNDQISAQNRVAFKLSTVGSGVTTLESGGTTIPTGSMTHVAAVYDGYNTMSLYIGGVRAATATVTGPIVQSIFESFIIGGLNANSDWPNLQINGGLANMKLAGLRITSVAMYTGSSFTPPTAPPPYVSRMSTIAIDWASANRPNVTGAGGENVATGWIVATGQNGTVTAAGVPTWVPYNTPGLPGYSGAVNMKNVAVQNNGLGGCLTLNSALYGNYEYCTFSANGPIAVTLDGYSYVQRFDSCFFGANTLYTGASWVVGQLVGSQYLTINGGTISGGGWGVVANAFAGIEIRDVWFETVQQSYGGILISADNGISVLIESCFIQTDNISTGTNRQYGSIYAVGNQNASLRITNGYLQAENAQNSFPQLTVDGWGTVEVDGTLFYPAGEELIHVLNIAVPVRIKSPQAYALFAIFAGYTTFGVTNGSPNVTASNTSILLQVGIYVQFASQPNTTYKVVTVNSSTGAATITPNYSGPTNTATSATEYGFPWMPESGSGQGPLLLPNQQDFGLKVVNMIASAGMTLWINDFLWKVIQITDTSSLLSGTQKVTLPLIAGNQRTFINSTSQTLTFGGATGSTISITAGGHANGVCDGTNWIVTS